MNANSPTNGKRYKLLALDVDGTLLDPEGTLRPHLRESLDQAASRGLRVVLCTGRRFRRAADMAHALGLPHPLVCNSGALVKDMATEATLWRADLDPSTFRRVLDVFASENRPAVCFTDRRLSEPDFVIERYPTHHIDFDDYVRVNLAHVEVQQGWPAQVISRSIPAFHLCAIGTRSEMLDFERSVLTLGAGVRTFVQRSPRYVGWMCEIVRHDAGKWNALAALAQRWKIAEAEICAVGDDMNDLCMIRNAGLGVAMPHAPDDVRAAAHHVLDSDRPEALATFLRTLC